MVANPGAIQIISHDFYRLRQWFSNFAVTGPTLNFENFPRPTRVKQKRIEVTKGEIGN